jgi:hypothetical protein
MAASGLPQGEVVAIKRSYRSSFVGSMNFGLVVEEPLLGLAEVHQDPVHVDVDDFFLHTLMF